MVNWNVKSITREILTDYYSENDDVKVYLNSESETGGVKVSNRSTPHEVQISNTDDFNVNRADITYSSLNKTAQVFVEIKSEKNKTEIWEETLNALLENRKLDDYNWDYIEIDDLSIEDPSFGIHDSVIQITFVKHSESI